MGLPNFYVTFLAQSLSTGGSESEIYVNSITTADGQTIAITDFAVENSTGYLIVDPQSSSNVEYISFTGVDGSGIGFTGATRGLSFKGDGSVIAANKVFHATGATVIIGWSSYDINNFVNKFTAQTITATLTFSVLSATPLLAVGTKSGNQAVSFLDVSNIITGTIGTATTLTYGTVRVSVNPVSLTAPIAVGDNDTRVPPINTQAMTAGEVQAFSGNNGTPSSTNTYVTQTGLQNGTETFAVASGTSVSYALLLSPALSSYKAGESFKFYAPFASGINPTININSLGAKNIYKKSPTGTTTLAIGDIGTNSFVQIGFDGGGFQLISPVDNALTTTPGFKNGQTTYDLSTASGNQVISHGLGVIPKYIRISVMIGGSATVIASSVGSYNGTTNACIYQVQINGSSGASNATAKVAEARQDASTNYQNATATFDATNITLAWTKTGSPTLSANIFWEAFA